MVIFFFFNSLILSASELIVLDDKTEEALLQGGLLDLYIDKQGIYDFNHISSPSFAHNFFKNPFDIIKAKNYKYTYWARFQIRDNSIHNRWILEWLDFKTDSITVYIPDGVGDYNVYKAGDVLPFSSRKYQHKNFVFNMSTVPGQVQTCYIKAQSNHPYAFFPVIRSYEYFTFYATTEYYLLALFYGIVGAMAVYNLFLFIAIRDFSYLFYVLYVVSMAAYTLYRDGTGFQYLWPEYPALNYYITNVAEYCMVVFALLYAKYFLNTKTQLPVWDKVILAIVALRTVLFLIGVFVENSIMHIPNIDMVPLFAIYTIGIISHMKGFKSAIFFVIAFTVLFVGFSFTSLQDAGILDNNWLYVYGVNIGFVAEMLLLSFALAHRIKVLEKQRNDAQNEIISQLQEKEYLKDKVTKELEQKVTERTHELEEKNKQLDSFVYKASHDIKGPLKSIIGLTQVGMKEFKDPNVQTYFEHILKSTKRLDSLLVDLLSVAKVKESAVQQSKIDFNKMIQEILYSFENLPGYEKIKVDLLVDQDRDFFADEKLLNSVLQNLIENGIKYHDYSKAQQVLKITVDVNKKGAVIIVKDNGLGIPREYHDKIFDMFFKVNENSSGTGLGMYIVKLSVDKLGGTIKLDSEPEKGSTFTVTI